MLKAFNFQSFYLANTPGVNEIEKLEKLYCTTDNIFFIGRRGGLESGT